MLNLFKKPAIGLDISDRSIEAVLVLKKSGKPVLVSYGRMVLPPGLVVNGYIEKRGELAVMIRKLLADGMTPPLPNGIKRVVFSLPESRVFSHVFQVPRIADTEELGRTLSYEANAFFPYHQEKLVSGHAVINTRPDTKEIYYAAVEKDMLRAYLGLMNEAQLEPHAIEGESTSIARALLVPGETEPVVLVDIGARVTDLSIFDREGTQFSETLQMSGDVITEAIALKKDMTFKDAEALKYKDGLSGTTDPEVQQAIMATIDGLIEEIRAAILFYEKRSERTVTRVILCGGSSLLAGLPEYISEKLQIPEHEMRVELGDPWLTLRVDEAASKARARGVLLATAIGLGLRGARVKKFGEINFLEKGKGLLEIEKAEEKKQGKKVKLKSPGLAKYPPWMVAGLAIILFLGTAVGTWFLAYRFYVVPNEERAREERASETQGPIETTLEARAVISDTFQLERRQIRGTEIPLEKVVSGSYDHEATESEGVAEAEFEFINETNVGQTLIPTTRVLSADGVLFRLRDRIQIPANGSIAAIAAADQPGSSGNVGPGRFTIPGLSASQQAVIYAELKSAATGGVVYEGTPLDEETFEANKADLLAGAEDALFEDAVKQGADFLMLRELFSVSDPVVTKGPKPGEPTGPYELEIKLTGEAIGLTESEVLEILAAEQFDQTGAVLDIDAVDISSVEIEVGKKDAESGEIPVTLRLKV